MSFSVRVDNVKNSIENISSILVNNPAGINFTTIYSENTDEDYFGSNFMILNSIYKGGIVAGVGYIVILALFFLVSLSVFFRKNRTREDIILSLSILSVLPFIFQRTALLETSMLVLIFSPYIIKVLNGSKKNP